MTMSSRQSHRKWLSKSSGHANHRTDPAGYKSQMARGPPKAKSLQHYDMMMLEQQHYREQQELLNGPNFTRMGEEREKSTIGRMEREGAAESEKQSGGRDRNVTSQRKIMNVVDFDPPPDPFLQSKVPQQRRPTRELEEFRFSIGSMDDAPAPRIGDPRSSAKTLIGGESDVALCEGYGRTAHNNEEGILGSSMEKVENIDSSALLGLPPNEQAAPLSQEEQRYRRSLEARLEGLGVSAGDLVNFVLNESGQHSSAPGFALDKSPENLGQLERELMKQVTQLSIGSSGEDGGEVENGSKFSVLREVVKLYMNTNNGENKPKNNNGGIDDNNNNNNDDDDEDGDSKKSELATKEKSNNRPSEKSHGGFLRKRRVSNSSRSPARGLLQRPLYNLGDEGCRRDMIKDKDKEVALMRIASLQAEDGAFIRRTTGKWTYAKVKNVASDSIVFIVNTNGSSKAYNVKYWVSHIRTLKAPTAPGAAKQQQQQQRQNGQNSPTNDEDKGGDPAGRYDMFAKQPNDSRFSTKKMITFSADANKLNNNNHDLGVRRGMFAKHSNQSRFSTRCLRLGVDSDDSDNSEDDNIQWVPR